jgi:hypothetical protein
MKGERKYQRITWVQNDPPTALGDLSVTTLGRAQVYRAGAVRNVIDAHDVGAANGVAPLNGSSKIDVGYLGTGATGAGSKFLADDYTWKTGGGGGGTLDHAALTSNLAWTTSGHTSTASRFAVFNGAGAAAVLAYPTTGLTTWSGTAFGNATVSAPLSYSAGTLSITQSDTTHDGYLSSTDFATFSLKVSTSRTISTTSPLTGGGDLSANRTIAITQSDATHDGYLSQTDWGTFNAKVAATRTISTTLPLSGGGDLSADRTLTLSGWSGTTDGQPLYRSGTAVATATVSSPLIWSGGALGIQAASGSQAGALSATDWTTFNGKEPAISAGTTSQYWRGDKTWQTLDKAAVGLGNVENTELSTWAGSTNIVTVGTIATGTWQGTAVAVLYGGTGAATASGARTNLGVAIGTNVQAWSTKLDALAALGNGFAYQGGGVWGAAAPGDLVVSGASVQVTQARGLRETAGPTTLAMGAVAGGELLRRSGTSIIGAAIGSVVQAYDAILAGVVALAGTTGIVVKSAASTFVTRTIIGSLQAVVSNGDGVSGNPTISIDPGYMSAAYHWYGMATDGVTLSGSNGVVTFSNSTTFTINGTNNIPEAQITASTITTQGVRTNAAICTLSQGMTHRFAVVTGSVKTLVRWRIGLALAASIGTALKPGGVVAMVVFDPDSGQANAATNWYLLTYDNGGGAVSYTDTTVACNVSTAYEIEIIPTTSLVSARVRTAGGSWSTAVTTSTSLPASGTAMNACCFLNPTAANARALQFRKWSAWVQY